MWSTEQLTLTKTWYMLSLYCDLFVIYRPVIIPKKNEIPDFINLFCSRLPHIANNNNFLASYLKSLEFLNCIWSLPVHTNLFIDTFHQRQIIHCFIFPASFQVGWCSDQWCNNAFIMIHTCGWYIAGLVHIYHNFSIIFFLFW